MRVLDECIPSTAYRQHKCLSTFLEGYGFTATTFDPCVIVGDLSTQLTLNCILSVYVDDIVLFGPECPQANQLVDSLKAEFEITGFWACKLPMTNKAPIYPKRYIFKGPLTVFDCLDRFQMANARPVITPIDPDAKATISTKTSAVPPTAPDNTESGQEVDNTLYWSIIGSLAYAATGMRPDLSFTVTYLSQFLESKSTKHEHVTTARRVLKYLRKTID